MAARRTVIARIERTARIARRAGIAGIVALAACRPADLSTPPVQPPAPSATSEDRAATAARDGTQPATSPATSTCPPRPSPAEAVAAFDRGREALKVARGRDEHVPAEVFDPAIADLRTAANAGHLGALVLLGVEVFGALYTADSPQPADREAWIEAITALRIAALAGDPDALAFAPGLAAAVPPPRDEPPWDEIPADWLAEAWRRADATLACTGLPWRTPPS